MEREDKRFFVERNPVGSLPILFDFAMHRVLAHDRVEFFQLQSFRRIFPVLLRDVTRCAGQTAGFMLGAFQDNLQAVAFTFLCHFIAYSIG